MALIPSADAARFSTHAHARHCFRALRFPSSASSVMEGLRHNCVEVGGHKKELNEVEPSASAYYCVCVVVPCVSLCQCSFVCVRHSIFYVCVTCCDLDVGIRLIERAREKARGNNNDPSHVPSKRKEEIKSGTSGCGSFVVPYFQPATSTDRLQKENMSFMLIAFNVTVTACKLQTISTYI